MAHRSVCPPFRSVCYGVSMTPTNRSHPAFPDPQGPTMPLIRIIRHFCSLNQRWAFLAPFVTHSESGALTSRSLVFVWFCLFHVAHVNLGVPRLRLGRNIHNVKGHGDRVSFNLFIIHGELRLRYIKWKQKKERKKKAFKANRWGTWTKVFTPIALVSSM